jgi:hypothetical protein
MIQRRLDMTYIGKPYYPLWLDRLADDATLKGAAMNGTARGADAVRSIVVVTVTRNAAAPA